MPSNDSFPLISDTSKARPESWGANLEERALQADGSKRRNGDQWLRRFSLTVYTGGGNDPGLELGMMRVDFQIKKMMVANPNFFYAKVYNLSPKTIDKVRQFNRVQLKAGYKTPGSQFGVVFDGTVVMYVVGKENPVDTYIEIFAGDADAEINHAVTVQTWPAGTPPQQKLLDHIKNTGLKVGEVKLTGEQKSVRSESFVGPSTDGIRNITNAYPSDFYIDDGKCYVIPWEGYRLGEIVNLAPDTGLVGIPKVTPGGIEAQCLLNPKLRLGGLVNIKAYGVDGKGNVVSGLSGIPYVPGAQSTQNLESAWSGPQIQHPATGPTWKFGAAAVNPTGIYKILHLEHSGDTRGNPWYSTMTCAAAGENGEILSHVYVGTALNRSLAVPGKEGQKSVLDLGGGSTAPS